MSQFLHSFILLGNATQDVESEQDSGGLGAVLRHSKYFVYFALFRYLNLLGFFLGSTLGLVSVAEKASCVSDVKFSVIRSSESRERLGRAIPIDAWTVSGDCLCIPLSEFQNATLSEHFSVEDDFVAYQASLLFFFSV